MFFLLDSKLFSKQFSPLLSQNNVIGDSILISKNSIIYLINRTFLTDSFWATIYASVLLWYMVFWPLDPQIMIQPSRKLAQPEMDFLVCVSPAQSESEYIVNSHNGLLQFKFLSFLFILYNIP